MNYQKITPTDIANGIGVRVTLWVSGCDHHCPECHNQITWDPHSGKPYTTDTVQEILRDLNHPWIRGLTFSGGDPLFETNREAVAMTARAVKRAYPEKDIWLYTGYTMIELQTARKQDKNIDIVLNTVDVIVDGEYHKDEKDVSFPWAGSKNQTVWERTGDSVWVVSEYNERKK